MVKEAPKHGRVLQQATTSSSNSNGGRGQKSGSQKRDETPSKKVKVLEDPPAVVAGADVPAMDEAEVGSENMTVEEYLRALCDSQVCVCTGVGRWRGCWREVDGGSMSLWPSCPHSSSKKSLWGAVHALELCFVQYGLWVMHSGRYCSVALPALAAATAAVHDNGTCMTSNFPAPF